MTHKVHPKIYRIKGIENWHSRGFYGKEIPKYLQEDFWIRDFLNRKLAQAQVASIEIERSTNKLNIIIKTARPGFIIGRGGQDIEKLKMGLLKELIKKKKGSIPKEIKLEIREIRIPWLSSSLVAQWMAQQIERRIPFRRVLKRSLDKVMSYKEIKGARVEVSGRLDGIEIARREWLQKGQLPRQTLKADIDYTQTQAYCAYGTVGVKVWLYKKGDVLKNKP